MIKSLTLTKGFYPKKILQGRWISSWCIGENFDADILALVKEIGCSLYEALLVALKKN